MNTPYVYFLKNKTTGLKYIGVRFAKKCNPSDFWTTYFTSSKLVKQLIELYGKDDFEYKILKSFFDNYEAIKYEEKLINIALKRQDYLNVHPGYHQDKEMYLINEEKMKIVRILSGKIQAANKIGFFGKSKEEKLKNSSIGGKVSAIVNRKNCTGIFSKEVQQKQHKTLREKQVSAFYNSLLRFEIASKGGKVGSFTKAYYEKNGLDEKLRIAKQRERGKIGGPKNKGFIWYNDGKKSFKYTKKQQDLKSFDLFLKENTNFIKGRIKIIKK